MRERFNGLDVPAEVFQNFLNETVATGSAFFGDLDERRTIPAASVGDLKSLFDEPMPPAGTEVSELLDQVKRTVLPNSAMTVGPNYYGFVTSGGNQAGVIGEVLRALLNQNPAKWIMAPAATEIELVVLRWIAEFIGYPTDSGGIMVSGGSEANLTCLKVARDYQLGYGNQDEGIRSRPQLTMYVSSQGHFCLDKSADVLGIGRTYLRKIPVNEDFTISPGQLERRVLEDKASGLLPACIIANAGTVNTGAVDPLETLAGIARRHGLWLHIDAAYGGPAASTPLTRTMFRGFDLADSVATDAHKWLYAPFEAGIAFVRNRSLLRKSFSIVPDYLRDNENSDRTDPTEYHFELSRDFKALKLWFAFKAYGTERLRRAIEENITTMQYLARLIDDTEDVERLAPVPLSIVCFRYRTGDRTLWNNESYLSMLNKRILSEIERDGRVFVSGTVLNGKQTLRACSVNHRTTRRHVKHLLDVIREVGVKVHRESLSEIRNGQVTHVHSL